MIMVSSRYKLNDFYCCWSNIKETKVTYFNNREWTKMEKKKTIWM